ncbi:MAG: hypothetical protein PVH95_04265 [Anaerolineae bacterium]|jgi:hypothetical protein
MEASVQDLYGSPGGTYQRVVVTRHGGPEVLSLPYAPCQAVLGLWLVVKGFS